MLSFRPILEAYIPDTGINLANILTLIIILETAFGDPDQVTTVERKLEALKPTNYHFSTYYAGF
jgi:hypothetical protein